MYGYPLIKGQSGYKLKIEEAKNWYNNYAIKKSYAFWCKIFGNRDQRDRNAHLFFTEGTSTLMEVFDSFMTTEKFLS